jgi:hypothetical protein
MTEQEWLAPTGPGLMLRCVGDGASDRKLRLFACACCRRIWHLLTDERSRKAVEVTERFADREATQEELAAAADRAAAGAADAEAAYNDAGEMANCAAAEAAMYHLGDDWTKSFDEAASEASGAAAARAATQAADAETANWAAAQAVDAADAGAAARATEAAARTTRAAAKAAEQQAQADLLRDIFSNPFRPSPPVPPTVLAWNDGTVRRMAEGIYKERAFDRMPILADALEDAGCANEDLLSHCRSEGPHVRGCWAVDLLLGRG